MDEMKSCPFCGGKATIDETKCGITDFNPYAARFDFEIKCKSCGATAPGACGHIAVVLSLTGELKVWHDDRPDAIKAWNRRPKDEQKG